MATRGGHRRGADGIRVEWVFFKGAGPAVNEALTNRQLEVAFQDDLPSIIGRAAGLKTKLIAAIGMRSNIYLAVSPDSPIQRVEDPPRRTRGDLQRHQLAVADPTACSKPVA